MSGASNWPPELKTYVNSTFSKCTDANRKDVEKELKDLIFKAFESNMLWKTDWANVKLTSLNPPKKRKAFVPSTPHSYGVSPSVSNPIIDETDRRDKRMKRFVAEKNAFDAEESEGDPSSSSYGNGNSNARASGSGSNSNGGGLANRLNGRFVQGGIGSMSGFGTAAYGTPEPEGVYDPNVLDWDNQTIVGTSQKLEKPFLRLTSLPDPKTIRPLHVLEKTLELLKMKWREESNYNYICDQFKSMRQDLTVQRIKNDFTCAVYEIHARIALEKGDLGEFNQCQGQLQDLYSHGLVGHAMEFLGYRILYLIFARNRAELNNTLASLTEAETSDTSVAHALAVRQAASQGNYTKFFRLFASAPKMGAYLMDHFVPRERVQALVVMTRAYQQVPLSLITKSLAFESTEDAMKFLSDLDANIYKPTVATNLNSSTIEDKLLDSKAALPKLMAALAKTTVDLKGQL